MFEQINEAAKQLANTQAGWVTRRDGAEFLGKVAAAALGVLNENRDEMDVDVRRVIDAALEEARAGLAGVKPKASGPVPLGDLVKACEKPGRREVRPDGDGYVIEVKLKEGRHQTVYVSHAERKDGIELIRVFTYCGKYAEEAMQWALRANTKLAQGALALTDADGEERFALVNCFLAGEVTTTEFKASVKEIAFYGDWVEKKLTGLDDF